MSVPSVGRFTRLFCFTSLLALASAAASGCGVPDVEYTGAAGDGTTEIVETGGTLATGGTLTGGVGGTATGGTSSGGTEQTPGGAGGAAGAAGSPGPECETSADCTSDPDRPVCDEAAGVCVECLPDSDQCADGEYCAADGTCVTGCADDSDCPDELVCSLATHLCVGCIGDEDCPAGSVCDASTSTCVPGCTADHPCPAGERCCAGDCADVQEDVEHCGACLQACSDNHGTPSCTGGECQIECDEHWDDCDEDPRTNGCETDLSTRESCGQCDRLCEEVNASENRCVLDEEQNEYQCVPECAVGFADDDGIAANGCETNIDDCTADACANGGVCIDGVDGYSCDCSGTGYTGGSCQNDIDECAEGTDNCDPLVSCTNTPGSFTCGDCPAGYEGDGTVCTDIDECAANPCVNGTCEGASPPATGFTCVCSSGWEGELCDQDIDGCADSPCSEGVECADVPAPGTGYVCGACPQGYDDLYGDGTVCVDIDACESHACVNGVCLDLPPPSTTYRCNCTAGWTGTYCDQDIDGCANHQCQNGSICTDNAAPATGYTCNCLSGWEGALCQIDIDGCAASACVNGVCQDVPAPGTGYTCSCDTGWTGTYCSQDVNGCAGNPCFPGVACTDVAAPGTGFTCGSCPAGYTGDGIDCTDIDGCVSHTCVNGTCIDDEPPDTGYSCSCDSGWEGANCDQDIDGCASSPCFPGVACTDVAAPGTGFVCDACPAGYDGDGQTCTDLDGCQSHDCVNGTCVDDAPPSTGYTCSCTSGWEGALCDQDIDGCAGDPCAAGVACTDVPAPGTGYTCSNCPPGYEGDGETCTEIDGCASHECANGSTCQDEPPPSAGYTCSCTPGWEGALCDQDIDGCADDPCFPGVACTDEPAPGTGYTCDACPAGYEGDGESCTDLDGCVGHACVNGTCEDEAPPSTGYTCLCDTGYDGTLCDHDIDGCAGDPCSAGVPCYDVPAPGTGYSCGSCPPGYDDNGVECVEIDACEDHQCANGSTCQDEPPPSTTYHCLCTTGWEGTLCDQDIDGCATNPCFAGVVCTDVPAPGTGYTCGACPAGYEGDGESCTEIDGCVGNLCANGSTCQDEPPPSAGYTCLCTSGWEGALCDQDIDGCATGPCFPGVTCTDVPAPGTGYTCGACPAGYEGDGETCTDIDGCLSHACINGTCVDDEPPSTGYTCSCSSGWEGTYCDQDIDGCDPNPCFPTVACTDVPAPGTGFTCGPCPTGYEGDGQTCTNYDACSPNPCVHGTCTDLAPPSTGYSCSCSSGWEGTNCDQDIDGCAGNPCFPGVACYDEPAPSTGFTCGPCPAGYEGDGEICTDFDGCVGNACANGSTCVDDEPPSTGYSCECVGGWEGPLCEDDIDGCIGNLCENGTCIDNVAPATGYTCDCETGWEGALCQNDIDGCVGNTCVHGSCQDVAAPGTGYSCICETGWEGDDCDQDIDGCIGNTCDVNATCHDVAAPGTGYTCECLPGYLDVYGNGTLCEPLGPCERAGSGNTTRSCLASGCGFNSVSYNYNQVNSSTENSRRMVMVGVHCAGYDGYVPSISSVTYAGISMYQIAYASGTLERVALYALNESSLPATDGTKAVVLTLGDTKDYRVCTLSVVELQSAKQGNLSTTAGKNSIFETIEQQSPAQDCANDQSEAPEVYSVAASTEAFGYILIGGSGWEGGTFVKKWSSLTTLFENQGSAVGKASAGYVQNLSGTSINFGYTTNVCNHKSWVAVVVTPE
jgi:hypothetical protein